MGELCRRGHDIAVVGRDKWRKCKECERARLLWRNEQRKEKTKRDRTLRPVTTHCKNGHELAVVGIYGGGTCRSCVRQRKMRDFPMVPAQVGDPCGICAQPMKKPNADHDHTTGAFRGWLCAGCNCALGHLERPGFSTGVLEYLQNHQRIG